MTVRTDLIGVSSFMRALQLHDYCYHRLLELMHSHALKLDKLSSLWMNLVLRIFPNPLRINGRYVLVGDGLKIGKEGRKMPAVKSLHQESDNNSKSEYITSILWVILAKSLHFLSALVKHSLQYP